MNMDIKRTHRRGCVLRVLTLASFLLFSELSNGFTYHITLSSGRVENSTLAPLIVQNILYTISPVAWHRVSPLRFIKRCSDVLEQASQCALRNVRVESSLVKNDIGRYYEFLSGAKVRSHAAPQISESAPALQDQWAAPYSQLAKPLIYREAKRDRARFGQDLMRHSGSENFHFVFNDIHSARVLTQMKRIPLVFEPLMQPLLLIPGHEDSSDAVRRISSGRPHHFQISRRVVSSGDFVSYKGVAG